MNVGQLFKARDDSTGLMSGAPATNLKQQFDTRTKGF
jgi:hypothetical protein